MLISQRFATLALLCAVLLTPAAATAGPPDLALHKTDGGTTVSPGEILIYSLDVEFVTGSADGSDIVFHETVPENTTYASGSGDVWLCTGTAAGSSCRRNAGPGPLPAPLTFAVFVDPDLPPGVTSITNTATISVASDPNPTNNTTSVTTPVAAGPDVAIEKSDGGITTVPGGTIVYSLDAQYVAGSPSSHDLVFTEVVPEHTTFLPAASDVWLCSGTGAGSTCSRNAGPGPLAEPIRFAVAVDQVLPTGVETILNTASVTIPGDPNPANNSITVATPVAGGLGGPDLAIIKDDGGITAMLGGTIVYSLDVTYVSGTPDAEDLIFSEVVPAHTTYAPGASDFWLCSGTGAGSTCTHNAGPGPLAAPVLFGVVVDATVPPGVMSIENTATVATATDPVPSNNSASTSTPFPGPDLALVKDDGGITATLGGIITYSLDVTYVTGSADSEELVFSEVVPEYTTYLPGMSDFWLCSGTGAGSTCSLNAGVGPLASSPVFTVVVDGDVPPDVMFIDNTAMVTTGTDPDFSNNTSTTLTPLTVPVELQSFAID